MTSTETTPERATTPTLKAVGHVALTVRDLAVSVPWYQALIGAEPVLDEDTGPFRHVVFVLGETMLGLHQFPEGIEDVAHTPRRPGLDHMAFAVTDRQELVAWARRLEAMGIEHRWSCSPRRETEGGPRALVPCAPDPAAPVLRAAGLPSPERSPTRCRPVR
jgi:catechol 2,3-dioxygenase-like lactoylglutathione lyase family enzyme